MNGVIESFHAVFGEGQGDLTIPQMAARAAVVYALALLMIRAGEKRFIGKNTAFDLVLAFILGSVVSRAVTGNAPFFPTMLAGAVLIALHWLVAVLGYKFDAFAAFTKGNPRQLVKDGEVLWKNMKKSHMGKHDLETALRLCGVTDMSDVKEARLERNGDISVIRKSREPRVIEVNVEQGVQTVRVEISD